MSTAGLAAAALRAQVPANFLGVWRRTLLEAPGMTTDTESSVFWLQTRQWHGDVRLPAHRPDFAACRNIVDCTPTQRRWLAGQKGFAGISEVTTVRTAVQSTTYCQWHRQVDFQPARPDRDFGRIVFFGDGASMDEFGVDAEYRETWVRLPQSVGPSGAWRRAPAMAARFGELLLAAGGCFFYLRDRALAMPDADELLALVDGVDGAALLDMELSFGRWDAVSGTGTVTHSTLPWREGQVISAGAGWSAVD